MSFAISNEIVLQAAVANGGNLTAIPYPSGTNQAAFQGIFAPVATRHQAVINGNDVISGGAGGFAVTFNAGDITVQNNTGAAWPIGMRIQFQFDRAAYPALTDNSGGTAAQTIAAIGATYVQAEVRNAVATLAAAINQLSAYVRANVPTRDQ